MRRLLIRTLAAGLAAVLFVFALTWYSSAHEHIPDHWPRVYLASDCPASEFAMDVAEGPGKALPLVTIPIDDGTLSTRACRHTQRLLAAENVAWSALAFVPDSLVCSRLILDGSAWIRRNRHHEWPVVISADGVVHLGADIQGIRTAGLDVSDEEYARMLEAFAAAKGEPPPSPGDSTE